MKVATDRLWTVWTTRKRPRLDHTAHSPGDDEVGHFSIVKWVLFQLSRLSKTAQVGHFSIVKWVLFRLTKTLSSVPFLVRVLNDVEQLPSLDVEDDLLE
jgi:hypothetical protein